MPYKEFEPKDSLEAVMSKLWGDPREVNPKTRLEEIILKIANAQPTGPSVPEITAQDEGKVLTVEDGEATWTASGGGGGGVLGVVASAIPDSPMDDVILNKTTGEIISAFENNIPIFVFYRIDPADWTLVYITEIFLTENEYQFLDNTQETYFASSLDEYPKTNYGA